MKIMFSDHSVIKLKIGNKTKTKNKPGNLQCLRRNTFIYKLI